MAPSHYLNQCKLTYETLRSMSLFNCIEYTNYRCQQNKVEVGASEIKVQCHTELTHWGLVTHICANRLTSIGSDNGLSPGRRQAIIWTNAAIVLIGPLGTNFSKIFIEIWTFSFKKMRLKMSSGHFYPGLNVLTANMRRWIAVGHTVYGVPFSSRPGHQSAIWPLWEQRVINDDVTQNWCEDVSYAGSLQCSEKTNPAITKEINGLPTCRSLLIIIGLIAATESVLNIAAQHWELLIVLWKRCQMCSFINTN